MTNFADKSSNQQQLQQAAFDVSKQAFKTTFAEPVDVTFSGGTQSVEINAQDDSVAIGDASTGETAGVVGGRLQVSPSALPSSTDFQVKTVSVPTSPIQITFGSLTQVSAITLTSPNDNTGDIKVGKSDVATNFYLLSPGATINLPVSAGASVYLVRDSGAGSYRITAAAVN